MWGNTGRLPTDCYFINTLRTHKDNTELWIMKDYEIEPEKFRRELRIHSEIEKKLSSEIQNSVGKRLIYDNVMFMR